MMSPTKVPAAGVHDSQTHENAEPAEGISRLTTA
jgi:hypothetical protein